MENTNLDELEVYLNKCRGNIFVTTEIIINHLKGRVDINIVNKLVELDENDLGLGITWTDGNIFFIIDTLLAKIKALKNKNRLAELIQELLGESMIDEKTGDQDAYNWWLKDMTVEDLINFIDENQKDLLQYLGGKNFNIYDNPSIGEKPKRDYVLFVHESYLKNEPSIGEKTKVAKPVSAGSDTKDSWCSNFYSLYETILEKTKLIAEFMGYQRTEKESGEPTYTHSDMEKGTVIWLGQFKYSSSWDSLMPVWSKIIKLSQANASNEPDARRHHSLMDKFENAAGNNDVLKGFEIVSQAIEWHNQTGF